LRAFFFFCLLVSAVTFLVLFDEEKKAVEAGLISRSAFNESLAFGGVFSCVGVLYAGLVFFLDMMVCRVSAVQKGDSSILFVIKPVFVSLYINGEKVDSGYERRFCLQGVLPDGTKVVVSAGYRWRSARIIFSDDSQDLNV
jgi:hypothetical protein